MKDRHVVIPKIAIPNIKHETPLEVRVKDIAEQASQRNSYHWDLRVALRPRATPDVGESQVQILPGTSHNNTLIRYPKGGFTVSGVP